jgi:hypothetical protein
VKRLAALTLALFVLPSVALATGDSNDETERLNRADMTLAKRSAVHKSDLAPGWRLVRSGPPKESSDNPCTSFAPDLSAFVLTGKHETSFALNSVGAHIVSDVGVFRNVRDAAGDFKASAIPAFLRCLRTVVVHGLRQANMRGRITSSHMSTTPRVGAQSVSYRVVATIYATKSAPRFKLYTDVIGFRQGRSQATLMFMAPFAPVRGQVALAHVVARRMQ